MTVQIGIPCLCRGWGYSRRELWGSNAGRHNWDFHPWEINIKAGCRNKHSASSSSSWYFLSFSHPMLITMSISSAPFARASLAAGGIASLQDAEEFIRLGADRLGTSRMIKIVEQSDDGSGY